MIASNVAALILQVHVQIHVYANTYTLEHGANCAVTPGGLGAGHTLLTGAAVWQ